MTRYSPILLLTVFLHPGARQAVRDFAAFFTLEFVLAHAALSTAIFLWIRRPPRHRRPSADAAFPGFRPRPPLTRSELLAAARRAATRRARDVELQMRRGLPALANISSTSFLLGAFGVVLGIVGSFKGVCGEKYAALAALNASLSESLVPGALALLTALPAWAAHQYFTRRATGCRVEMDNITLELLNYLSRPTSRS